jgi:hypothetical protein
MQQACLNTRASFVAGRSAAPARRGRTQQVRTWRHGRAQREIPGQGPPRPHVSHLSPPPDAPPSSCTRPQSLRHVLGLGNPPSLALRRAQA